MKSEERHKLQQNELADYLAKAVENLKPYQNGILGGIMLILVAILLVHWWNGKSAKENELASTEFYNATNKAMTTGNPSELVALVDKYPGHPSAPQAALTAGDIYLNSACTLLFSNKAKAKGELGDAVTIYQKVLPTLTNPFLKAQATFGLARTQECQNQLNDAKKNYEEIVKNWPDGPYGVLAARRLENLKSPSIKEKYDLFANAPDPKAFKDDLNISDKSLISDPTGVPEEPLIKTGTIGEKLRLDSSSKDIIKPEDILKDKTPPTEPPATEEKKTDETKPADAAQMPPESSKPAEGEKPAEAAK
jgi:predicted negative regulator of RcsB-dependent stress response